MCHMYSCIQCWRKRSRLIRFRKQKIFDEEIEWEKVRQAASRSEQKEIKKNTRSKRNGKECQLNFDVNATKSGRTCFVFIRLFFLFLFSNIKHWISDCCIIIFPFVNSFSMCMKEFHVLRCNSTHIFD